MSPYQVGCTLYSILIINTYDFKYSSIKSGTSFWLTMCNYSRTSTHTNRMCILAVFPCWRELTCPWIFLPQKPLSLAIHSSPIIFMSLSTTFLAGHPLPPIPAISIVKTLLTSESSILLNTCPDHPKQCLPNCFSINSTPILSATSELLIPSINE